MVSIVLASHGAFAEGIKMSGEMIFGPQEAVAAVTLTPDMGPTDLFAKLQETVAGFENQEQVLFLVDLQGGTPWNQVSTLLEESKKEGWVAVGGLSLPMLIAAFGARMGSDSAAEVAQEVFAEAVAGVVIKPEALAPAPAQVPVAEAPKAGAIPEGTVLGNGKIDYVLCRIDTRLLHGQVATAWTKTTRPDRIIVVSDKVSKDDLRKEMIKQAAPPGVTAHCVPISKMVEVSKDPRFGATKALLLFESPEELLSAVKAGLEIKEINLGSIAHSVGKVVCTDAIAMGTEDLEALEALVEAGCVFDVRKMPSSSPESFDAIMKKAKAQLSKA